MRRKWKTVKPVNRLAHRASARAALAAILALPGLAFATSYPTDNTSNFTIRTQDATSPPFAGAFVSGGSSLGLFANSGDGNFANNPQAVAFHLFTTDGSNSAGSGTPLQVGQQLSITLSLSGSNGINGNSVGFALNNGSDFNDVTKYNNANRFELSFTGGQSSARIYDSVAGTDTGTNFTTFKAGQTYTFTLISDNEYSFSTSGGASFNVRVLGGAAGNAIQSFSLFNRGYNNDDAIFGSIGVTDLGTVTYQANTGETKTVAGRITNGAISNSVLIPGAGTVIFSGSNSYAGTTTVTGGTLNISNDNNLGAVPGAVTANSIVLGNGAALAATAPGGVTLAANRGITLGTGSGVLATNGGNLTLNGAISIAGNRLVVRGTSITTLNGTITGAGDLLKQNTGTTIFAASNTFGGGTSNVFIDEGSVVAAASGALGTANGTSTGLVNMGASGSSGLNTALYVGTSGVTLSNPIDARFLQTGGKAIGVTMSAGTGTFSGKLTLHDSVTLSAVPGSTAVLSGVIERGGTTGATTPNGSTLTFNTTPPAGGFTATPGIIINSATNTGTVELRGANTYAGESIVNGGTLQFNGGGNNGSSGSIRLSGTSAVNIGDAAGGNTIANTINPRNDAGIKRISASNTSGTNTYSGPIALDGDVTVISNNAGATLAFSGSDFDLKNQTVTFAGNGNTTVSQVVRQSTGSGKLTKQGPGSLTLTGADTFSGTITMSGGVLSLSGADGGARNSGTIVLNGGTIRADNTLVDSPDRFRDAGTITLNGGSISLVGKADTSASETVGTFALGSGAVGGASTVVLQNGTAGSTSAVLTSSTLFHNDPRATVNFIGLNGTIGSAGNNPRMIFTTAPGTTNGVIADAAASAAKGWATVNGTSFANYGANGVVAAGTVDYSTASTNDNAQLTTGATINSSGKAVNTLKIVPASAGLTLDLTTNSGNLSTNAILLTGNDFTIQNTGTATGKIASTASTFFYIDTGRTLTVNVLVSGQPAVKSGPGLIIFGNTGEAGQSDALNINAGVARATPGSTLLGGAVRLRGGGVLEADVTAAGASFTRVLGTAAANVNFGPGGGGFSAIGNSGSNVFTVNIGGASAGMTWGGTDFAGDDQPLVLGSSFANRTVDFANPIDLNGKSREVRTNGSASLIAGKLSGVVSGTAVTSTLVKTGPAALSLTAPNTYAGGTVVSAGELLVNNTSGSGTGTGSVSVSAGGLLAGAGTISGDTTFASGAQVSPGDFGTSGKLSVGNFTLASGVTLQVEVGGDHTGTPGVTFDQIAVGGSGKTFVVGGANLAVIPLGSVELNVPYRIVDATGNIVNAAAKFANLLNGVNYDDGNVKYAVTYNPSSIDVTFTSVPEPTSLAVFAGGISFVMRRPRRRG